MTEREKGVIDFRQDLSLRPGELPGLEFVQPDPIVVQEAQEQMAKLRLKHLRGERQGGDRR